MDPIKFPEANETLAKNQPQFRALPVCIRPMSEDKKDGLQFTCKYELSEVELAQILLTKSIYFSQFGHGFQPIRPQIESPFMCIPVSWIKVADYSFEAFVPLQDGTEYKITGLTANMLITNILLSFPQLEAENIFLVPRPALAIDESGKLTGF